MLVGLRLWPACQLVNQSLVPLQFRTVSMDCVSFFWDMCALPPSLLPSRRPTGRVPPTTCRHVPRSDVARHLCMSCLDSFGRSPGTNGRYMTLLTTASSDDDEDDSTRCTSPVSVGDKLPEVALDYGFPPTKVQLSQRLAGKKAILLGLPGAFTPC